ncbi:MAG TPA: DUF4258 domain-containing protein [Terriglobia bacterium]
MNIRLHPHALARLAERGTTEDEVVEAVRTGERFPAKYGRIGFRRNFSFGGEWRGRHYATKQVEAYAVEENGWLVITAIVRYF